MAKKNDAQQRLLDLLSEVLAIARTLAPVERHHGPIAAQSPGRGIYPHQSKYNPWRAYVWDRKKRRAVYVGAFPSIAKARAAQHDYRAGNPVASGTKAHLRVVA
jgi:hypothetical protein